MVNLSRKLLNQAITAGALVMALLALVILATAIQTARDPTQRVLSSLAYDAGQIEHEARQLLDHLDRFGDDDREISHQDVLTRFDILWSRVFSEKDLSGFSIDPQLLQQNTETLRQGQALLQKIEQDVLELSRNDPETIIRLKYELRRFLESTHKLRSIAMGNRVLNVSAVSERQVSSMYLSIILLVGLGVFGFLSIVLVRSDRNAINRMNTQLEYRVRKRTADLEAANARLALEVAERKRDQANMAEREARLAQAAQLAKLGYYVWNFKERKFEVCSDTHAASHGMDRQEFMATSPDDEMRINITHPDDIERRREKIKELEAGQAIEYDYRVKTSNGVRRLRESARPIFDDKGNVVRGVGSTLDLTDKYETEMKLYEAQRMDSIGKMTGGVAHDFNNLLAVILGNLELIREDPTNEDREEMIDDAISATLRGRDLTMSMLSFARRAPMAPSKLNLNTVIADMQTMLRRTLPITIDLKTELDQDTWSIVADRSLTESAVLNLAINAMDAMPDGGELVIATENIVLNAVEAAGLKADIAPGNYVRMTVRDTGGGIDLDLQENIFEPFFTTKCTTKNSGLGLSMVQGFIQQTGGSIRTHSAPDQGAAFELYFPSADSEKEAANAIDELPAPDQPQKPLRVLLVEDDDNVRKVLARQMELTGMTVISAAESSSAEIAFDQNGPFDLVISDIVMPGELQGPALVRRLRETDGDLPAIFLSGYPREIAVHGNGVAKDDVMLMKPVGRDDLLVAIDCAMNPGTELVNSLPTI